MLLILELMSRKGKSLASCWRRCVSGTSSRARSTPRWRAWRPTPEKIERLAAKYADGHVYHLDGISVEFPDWHFNVRASNTEPLLRLNLEGETPEIMERRRDEVLGIIRG